MLCVTRKSKKRHITILQAHKRQTHPLFAESIFNFQRFIFQETRQIEVKKKLSTKKVAAILVDHKFPLRRKKY